MAQHRARKVIRSGAIRYSQVVDETDEHAERDESSPVTRNHEVIHQWTEERDAMPATGEGRVHAGDVGVLRIEFPGGATDLKHISGDEWFGAFDRRELNFTSQERPGTVERATSSGCRTPPMTSGARDVGAATPDPSGERVVETVAGAGRE
jgi:hypothetical protein